MEKLKNGVIIIEITDEVFNQIVELVNTASEIYNDEIKEKSEKLMDKLLKYPSYQEGKVTLFLFPSDTKYLIQILFTGLKPVKITKDWTKKLIANKENFKHKKESEKNA